MIMISKAKSNNNMKWLFYCKNGYTCENHPPLLLFIAFNWESFYCWWDITPTSRIQICYVNSCLTCCLILSALHMIFVQLRILPVIFLCPSLWKLFNSIAKIESVRPCLPITSSIFYDMVSTVSTHFSVIINFKGGLLSIPYKVTIKECVWKDSRRETPPETPSPRKDDVSSKIVILRFAMSFKRIRVFREAIKDINLNFQGRTFSTQKKEECYD